MKKLLSLALVLMMLLSIMPLSLATEDKAVAETVVGLENFTKKNSYKPGQFTDFLSSDWFSANVITAYELGLVKGTTETNFNPKGNITVAETIVLACRLHNIYNGGNGEFKQGYPWYQVYVDYALANRIIPGTYSDYNAKISRANFAFILNNALPAEALKSINNIANGAIYDVKDDSRTNAIYNLYRAGVLTGSDKYGTFKPDSNIQRSEVATIVTRMADRTQRKMFILEDKPKDPESVTLTGKTTINTGETTQWKATIAPSGANQWVSWASGNSGVATVDANGNIKGLKDGQSNITATAVNGVKKTVLLTVGSLKPTSVTLAGKTTIPVGESTQWKATVAPSGANQWVSWSSGNPGVATVDAYGYIKGVKAGKANITATAVNGVKKTVLVNVVQGKKSNASGYGQVRGTATYQYNKYVGTRADVGAKVLLIPTDYDVSIYDNHRAAMLMKGEYASGIRVTTCDGSGNYDFGNRVPAGKYLLVIVSDETTDGRAFGDNKASWYSTLSLYGGSMLSSKDFETYKLFVGFSKIYGEFITVNDGEILTVSNDFGYTYI